MVSTKVLRREKLLKDYPYYGQKENPNLRPRPKTFPNLSEVELMRHYHRLASQNYSWEDGLYPLGSCTMKYNPVFHGELLSDPILKNLSCHLPENLVQGALSIIYETETILAKLTDLPKVTLYPAAGAHGELCGVLMVRKYFLDRKQKRSVILIPDSAHGTNPASAAMAGFTTQTIPSTQEGLTDIVALKKALTPDVAAFMLTNPNTLGVFEEQILKIKELLEKNGSLLYIDGANFNALVGKVSLGAMGADLVQLNLHKTFSTPHGGGGPGQGALAVSERLMPYLPGPQIKKEEGGRYTYYFPEKSMGRLKMSYGHFANIVRAWAYLKTYGFTISEIAETAVLNANYLRKKLQEILNLASKKPCMHEVVFDQKKLQEKGLTTMELAKALLDQGFYAPTVYFPLIVSGAIMVEPTETETIDEMNEFVSSIKAILEEPELAKNSPKHTFVLQIDEAQAARNPILSWLDG